MWLYSLMQEYPFKIKKILKKKNKNEMNEINERYNYLFWQNKQVIYIISR